MPNRSGCGSNLVSFLAQGFVFYPLVLFGSLPIFATYRSSLIAKPIWNHLTGSHVADALVVLAVGVALGIVLGHLYPGLREMGVWIGAFAAIPFLFECLSRALQSSAGPWEASHTPAGDEGLTVILVTLPAFSGLGYSVGLLVSNWKLMGKFGRGKSAKD